MPGKSVHLSGELPPCPDRFNAAEWCLCADVPADAEAFLAVDPDKGVVASWSFADLRARVRRAAGALAEAGVGPGDRVVLLLGDVPAFPVAYFGAIAAGAVATPLSSQLSESEVSGIIEAVTPKVVIGGKQGDLSAASLQAGPDGAFVPRAPDDPALLVFTSGSSGRPKGVLHAHRAFWARQSMHDGWHGIRSGDRVMHAGAFNWTFTLGVGLADTWNVGATAILNAGPRDPEVWPRLARTYAPTVFAAAPAVYRRILKYGSGLDTAFASLRHAVTAGEALSPSIADEWTRTTGKPLLEALGMSEVSTYISTPPDRSPEHGIAGWPQPGRHVAVLGTDGLPVDFGESGVLAVHRGDPGLTLGYWQDKAATDAAYAGDWFRTGDRVRMRADGAISYLGREDDQMNAQGYRVDPGEVEAAFLAHPAVAECGAAEIEVEEGLSLIGVWLVLEASVPAEELMATARERLAVYKLPRALFHAETLPHSANGKLQRRKLPSIPARPLYQTTRNNSGLR